MRHILPLAVALATIYSSASAATVCKQPDWRAKPTQSQLFAVWPREAFQKGQNGKAHISCKVSPQGALHDCTVLSEDPPNAGFGHAALALTPQFLMTPAICDGKSAEGDVQIPITFAGLTPHDVPGAGIWSRLPPRPSRGPLVIAQVPWIAAPTYAQVVAAYPEKARADREGGHVALNCAFGGDGRIVHCDVLSEVPAGGGFAAAARALSKDFVGPRAGADGASLQGDTTTVAFTFDPAMLNGQTPIIGKPQWTHVPDAVDVTAGFPAAAAAARVTVGHVALSCDVGEGGHLTNCAVTRQVPPDLGFDKAAMALSAIFQVTVWTDEGLPTIGGRITVPIRYEAAAEPAPSANGGASTAASGAVVRAVTFTRFVGKISGATGFPETNAGPYYPDRAGRLGLTGVVVLECEHAEQGGLDACAVISEKPAKEGFGYASKKMAERRVIRLELGDPGGDPKPGERVRVSVPFVIFK